MTSHSTDATRRWSGSRAAAAEVNGCRLHSTAKRGTTHTPAPFSTKTYSQFNFFSKRSYGRLNVGKTQMTFVPSILKKCGSTVTEQRMIIIFDRIHARLRLVKNCILVLTMKNCPDFEGNSNVTRVTFEQ